MIGRITPDGIQGTPIKIPTSSSGPRQIITGPDGSLWFDEYYAGKIGKLDPQTGQITEFKANIGIGTSLAFGPDGNLWFTEYGYGMIGRMTPDGQVLNLPIPTPGPNPYGITEGPDGYLWFSEFSANQIAKINPNNFSVPEFPIPTANSSPTGITTGPDGNLWFAEYNGNKIGQITVGGSIQEFKVPTNGSEPFWITVGPDYNIWFTEYGSNKIGRYDLTLPANHFQVSAATSTTAGTPFSVTITALDPVGRTVTDYTGTVHFTSSDLQATLPDTYTFTAGDNGTHTFSNGVTLVTPGSQTVTATDTANNITGSATVTVTASTTTVDHLFLSAPNTVVAGSAFDLVVAAVDAQGQVVPGYTGTVSFTSTDPYLAGLPANYTFTPSDSGTHTFAGVSLFTAGPQTLTAQDTVNHSITGTVPVTVSAASANHFVLSAPSTAVAGTPFNVILTAFDPYGNQDTSYSGTVIITSLDRYPQPFVYTFTPGDNGSHNLSVSLFTAGAQTLLARDTGQEGIAAAASVAVTAAPADQFLVTAPSTAVSGMPFNVIVTALDPYGNTDTNYQGMITFATSDPDPGVTLPAPYTFTTGSGGDNGVHAFVAEVTLLTPGNQTITATDTANGFTGNASVTVNSPAPPPGGGASGPWSPGIGVGIMPVGSVGSGQTIALLDQVFASLDQQEPGMTLVQWKHPQQIDVHRWVVDLLPQEGILPA
jgi:streptogramin lyase